MLFLVPSQADSADDGVVVARVCERYQGILDTTYSSANVSHSVISGQPWATVPSPAYEM